MEYSEKYKNVEIKFTLIACISENKVLMLKRFKEPFKGKWNFLGGKIEFYENPVYSAKREIEEEAGFSFKDTSFLRFRGVFTWPDSNDNQLLVGMHLFSIKAKKITHHPQMQFLDEGYLSWRTVEEVSKNNCDTFVPNAPTLLNFLNSSKRKIQFVIHDRKHKPNEYLKSYPINSHYSKKDNWEIGRVEYEVTELL